MFKNSVEPNTGNVVDKNTVEQNVERNTANAMDKSTVEQNIDVGRNKDSVQHNVSNEREEESFEQSYGKCEQGQGGGLAKWQESVDEFIQRVLQKRQASMDARMDAMCQKVRTHVRHGDGTRG